MPVKELLLLPNLLSLSRIPLALMVWYFLSLPGDRAVIAAAVLITVAGVTDGLDGFVARSQGLVTPLGIALDPIADKVFAAVLILGLIFHRDFPLWLAGVIVGRDLVILAGGLLVRRRRKVSLPSNITGKYTFAAIAVLLASYVIRYEFGIYMLTIIVVVLTAASLVSYGRVFAVMRSGQQVKPYRDPKGVKVARLVLLAVLSVIYLVKLGMELFC